MRVTGDEALRFLEPAVGRRGGTWCDLGAGTGTFTLALATLLGESGRVIAIDRDAEALKELDRRARHLGLEDRVRSAEGDLSAVERIAALKDLHVDGALVANALHYLADPRPTLAAIANRLKPGGNIILIEYERDAANPYVPYPLPFVRLRAIARAAGLTEPVVKARRPSRYQGELYCCVASVEGDGRVS